MGDGPHVADALKLDVAQVRRWETGEEFPTKANCESMEGLRKNPPVKVPKKGETKVKYRVHVRWC